MSETVTISIMGKPHKVPANLTIMKAMEYAGYKLLRGCGCRGGFCGACATVYRLPGDYRLFVALACQEVVRDGMFIAQIPVYPSLKETYDITKMRPEPQSILALYPVTYRCVGCNTCTKSCPQDIDVMGYVQSVLRGDIEAAANESFDCVMCGLCATRCPAEIPQFLVGILARRLYGAHLAPKAEHTRKRIEEINSGKFDAEIEKLMKMETEELKRLYQSREKEK